MNTIPCTYSDMSELRIDMNIYANICKDKVQTAEEVLTYLREECERRKPFETFEDARYIQSPKAEQSEIGIPNDITLIDDATLLDLSADSTDIYIDFSIDADIQSLFEVGNEDGIAARNAWLDKEFPFETDAIPANTHSIEEKFGSTTVDVLRVDEDEIGLLGQKPDLETVEELPPDELPVFEGIDEDFAKEFGSFDYSSNAGSNPFSSQMTSTDEAVLDEVISSDTQSVDVSEQQSNSNFSSFQNFSTDSEEAVEDIDEDYADNPFGTDNEDDDPFGDESDDDNSDGLAAGPEVETSEDEQDDDPFGDDDDDDDASEDEETEETSDEFTEDEQDDDPFGDDDDDEEEEVVEQEEQNDDTSDEDDDPFGDETDDEDDLRVVSSSELNYGDEDDNPFGDDEEDEDEVENTSTDYNEPVLQSEPETDEDFGETISFAEPEPEPEVNSRQIPQRHERIQPKLKPVSELQHKPVQKPVQNVQKPTHPVQQNIKKPVSSALGISDDDLIDPFASSSRPRQPVSRPQTSTVAPQRPTSQPRPSPNQANNRNQTRPNPGQAQSPPVKQPQTSTTVKDDIPKNDIRAFLRKYPNSDINFLLQYYSAKQIEVALKTGKIVKRKDKFKIS